MAEFSDNDIVVSGVTAKYISIASFEFEKKLDVNWDNYIATVNYEDDAVIVIFSSKNISSGLRGSEGGVPGFEVIINKRGFEVLDSHFVR